MSIFNYCQKCYGSFSLALHECPKCLTPVPTKGKKFRIELMIDCRRITEIVPNSIAAAREKEAELRTKGRRGEVSAMKNKINLDEAFQSYNNENQIKNMEHLKWDYERHIKPRFGLYPLQRITPALVEQFKYDLLKTLSPKTVKNIIMIISAIFNFAKRLGYSGTNPLERVQKPRIKNEVMNMLTDEVITACEIPTK